MQTSELLTIRTDGLDGMEFRHRESVRADLRCPIRICEEIVLVMEVGKTQALLYLHCNVVQTEQTHGP